MGAKVMVQTHREFEVIEREADCAPLDLVVPFTTPQLTRLAMHAANRMAAGIKAGIRLVKVQIVPFPMDVEQSPVALAFIREQLQHFESKLPAEPVIRLARDFEPGLLGALKTDSVVVIGHRKRAWRTREERLASRLKQSSYHVVLVGEE